MAVELARRRVALCLWILETRPRSRSATSNVLKLAGQVQRTRRKRSSSAQWSQLQCTLRWRTATTPNVCSGAVARVESAWQHTRDVRMLR